MAWRRRIARDIKELSDGGFSVTSENGSEEYSLNEFVTTVSGPADSPYAGCVWNVRFTIPEGFPFTSPSVGFVQKIYHPNIDEDSGTICLDALNKAWSPTFTIKHIVETVLPYLLNYPNPDDPLNREAAHLMKTNLHGFNTKAKQHSLMHSKKVL
jgi:ubiquitin-conjugating enzyme E2 H